DTVFEAVDPRVLEGGGVTRRQKLTPAEAFSSSRSPRTPSIGLMPARSASSAAARGLSHWSLGHGCRAYRRLEAAPLLVFAAKNKRVSLTRRNLKSGRLLSVCKNLRQHARLRAENSREGGHIMSET